MGLFRRQRDAARPTPLPAITEFWQWWAQARPKIEASLGDGPSADLIEELSLRVHRIHPHLQWEIGRPDGGVPTLTVTGGGDGELRGLAERWLRAAPTDTGGWALHAARQADPEMLTQKLTLGDHEFDLEYVRVGMRADQARARVHVAVYHPDFLFVAEEARRQVAGHVLDWALGEDDVARWIGEVTIATEPPMDALPPGMLPAVVDQIAEQFREPTWLWGEGRTPRGHPARLGARFPLHRQDHPLCDLHVAVSVPYAHSNPDRLPVEPSASALRELEKKLDALGPDAVLAVQETGDGLRVYHLYADPDSGVLARLDQLAASWPEGRAKVASAPDPGWRALAPYRP
ncbi:DUF695 domain-containing protein [Thermomonospora sp. CIF 1]|uniref:DUF695 domain-containing protein n=1 Tax=Thermomonospora sp. CIF 1 TaxID=1916083 RepID=UPI000AF1331F|nr:DUF695 domain-containing protein [Thermomonospora sp. CIF 1]PKK13284.1 MAG: DUF695 domain-containing protein [Thermomonospora sp. CIF 1]